MGVLNVTPDSFSDGGRYIDPAAAVEHALSLASQGADLIDVGGESSRPGAQRIAASQQIARTRPVVEAVRAALDAEGFEPVVVSIDTTSAAVAEAALGAGASMVNDISAGREDPELLALAAKHRVPVCLMHMRGQPQTMQDQPLYDDVVPDVERFLNERTQAAVDAGVARDQVVVDPGIGFGKTLEHNLAILRSLDRFVASGQPVLLGASRKSVLARLAGRPDLKVEPDPGGGTAATTALGVAAGARLFRVHDVALNRQAADIADAIAGTPR